MSSVMDETESGKPVEPPVDLLHIRVRGKVLVFHRAVLGYVVCAAFSAPLLWRQWTDGPLVSSDRALLLISLGALVVCEGLIAHRLYTLCSDADRQTVDRWAAVGSGGADAARVIAVEVGGFSLLLLGWSIWEVTQGSAERSVLLAVAAIGLTGLTGLVYAMRFRTRADTQGPSQPQRALTATRRPDLAIACSGGGIRSAAFCLGALQRLRRREGAEKSLYDQADAVYSVSGGGYIATGIHVARHSSPDAVADDVFMPGSPEEDRLRRTSSYLLATATNRTLGVLSLFFGLLVNLVLLVAVMALVAWWVAAWLRDSGALADYTTWFPQDGAAPVTPLVDADLDTGALPTWVRWSIWLPVAAVGLFVAHKLLVRLFHASLPPYRIPSWAVATSRTLDAAVPPLVLAGVATTALLLGTPWAVAQVGTATVNNEPTVAVAGFTARAGFASTAACRTAAEQSFRTSRVAALNAGRDTFGYGACGKSAQDVPTSLTSAQCKDVDPTRNDAMANDCAGFVKSVGTTSAFGGAVLLSGLTGIVAAIMRAPKQLSAALPSRVAAWLRTRLLPWLGAVLVVVAAAVGFLKLTFDLTLRDPFTQPPVFDRTSWLWAAAVAILLVKVIADATSSSMHPFYRRRLATTFLLQREENGLTRPVPYSLPTLVSGTPPEPGTGPALVICGAANISDPEFIPTQRECSPFRFATAGPVRPAAIGLSDAWRLPKGMRPAPAYEEAADPYRRDATMAAAMAISGAAISPRTGRANRRSRPYRLLLALANARLGVWLPNPYWVEDQPTPLALGSNGLSRRARAFVRFVRTFSTKPGPFRLVKEAIGTSSIYDRRIYVTDGGHYDNTALVEALRDRPKRLIVIDASNDAENTFSALGDAVATARMDLGLEVELEGLDALVRTDGARADRAWASGTARPVHDASDEEKTDLQIVKAIMFRDGLPLDLETYQVQHPEFPRTSTGDQLYGEYDFEAYRRLGYAAMDRALADFALPRETRTPAPLGGVDKTHASTPTSPPRGAEAKKRKVFGTSRSHGGAHRPFRSSTSQPDGADGRG